MLHAELRMRWIINRAASALVAGTRRICVMSCCLTEHHFLSLCFPVLTLVNGEHLVDPVLPPISWTSTPSLPLQPLLQGWEQPHRAVSHQFCACRLLHLDSSGSLWHLQLPSPLPPQGRAAGGTAAGGSLEVLTFSLPLPLFSVCPTVSFCFYCFGNNQPLIMFRLIMLGWLDLH